MDKTNINEPILTGNDILNGHYNGKMIEEMAKDMGIAFQISGTTRFSKIAEMLVSYGYRKIQEGAVVLTGTEKQKLLHGMYEQGKFDALADLEKDGKVVVSKAEYDSKCLLAKECIEWRWKYGNMNAISDKITEGK